MGRAAGSLLAGALAMALATAAGCALAEEPVSIDAGAFAAAPDSLVGRTVTLTGGYVGVAHIIGKKFPKAFYGRQDMKAILIDAAGIDDAVAAGLDPLCQAYTQEHLEACAYDVTGLIATTSSGTPKITNPSFARR